MVNRYLREAHDFRNLCDTVSQNPVDFGCRIGAGMERSLRDCKLFRSLVIRVVSVRSHEITILQS
jgi:hypothetical protein